jgi:hypothetical protein
MQSTSIDGELQGLFDDMSSMLPFFVNLTPFDKNSNFSQKFKFLRADNI